MRVLSSARYLLSEKGTTVITRLQRFFLLFLSRLVLTEMNNFLFVGGI